MSAKDADILAKATWDRGIEQFSIVTDMKEGAPRRHFFDQNTTIIPMNFSIDQHYPGMDAMTAAKQMLYDYTEKYYSKGLHIENPKVFYNPEGDWIDMNLVNADDEFIIVFRTHQYRDQWVTGLSECEIEVNGEWIKETKNEGMDGFLNHYFWNPTYGYFYQTVHFPALPKDVKTINFREKTLNINMKKVQVTEDVSMFNNIRSINVYGYTRLKTTHLNDEVKDEFYAERVDFDDNETTVYCAMYIRANHSFPGHIGNDYKLTLGDGTVLDAIRIEGIPVNEDFDRHGDWVSTPYQVIFPAISEEQWNKGVPVLSGSVIHEPVSIKLLRPGQQEGVTVSQVSEILPGKYELGAEILHSVEGEDYFNATHVASGVVEITGNGKISFTDDKTGNFPKGKYNIVWKKLTDCLPKDILNADEETLEELEKISALTFKVKGHEYVFEVRRRDYEKDSPNYNGVDYQYMLSTLMLNKPEDGTISMLILTPIE